MRLPLIPKGMLARAWPPVLLTRCSGAPSAWHSHHSLRFALATEGELLVRVTREGRWSKAAGVLTPADTAHAIAAENTEVLLIFLDPESAAGAAFRSAISGPVRLISAAERDALTLHLAPRAMQRFGAEEWLRNAAERLGVPVPAVPRAVHPRIRKLLEVLRTGGVGNGTSLAALASTVGLSPSRLMHVFTSSIGIPLRPYLAWLRVQRAASAIVSGSSLSDAAHSAGFSDAAHMSRTFKRMLGTTPSSLRAMRCAV